MPLLGLNEAVLIGAAALALVLGPKKLPELARALGKSKQEYNKSMHEANQAVEEMSPDAESELEDAEQ